MDEAKCCLPSLEGKRSHVSRIIVYIQLLCTLVYVITPGVIGCARSDVEPVHVEYKDATFGFSSMVLGPDGSIYAAGCVYEGAETFFDSAVIVRFSQAYEVIGSVVVSDVYSFSSIAASPDGTLYAIGNTKLDKRVDNGATIIRFDADLKELAQTSWDGDPEHCMVPYSWCNEDGIFKEFAVAVDGDGAVYASGTDGRSAVVRKYDAELTELASYTDPYQCTTEKGCPSFRSLAIAPDGTILAAGCVGERFNERTAVLRRFSPDLVLLGSAERPSLSFKSVAVAQDGTVYVTCKKLIQVGSSGGVGNENASYRYRVDALLLAYDAGLTEAREWSPGGKSVLGCVRVGGDGTVYVSGSLNAQGHDPQAMAFFALSPDLQVLEQVSFGGRVGRLSHVELSPSGSVYVAGVADRQLRPRTTAYTDGVGYIAEVPLGGHE